MKFRNFSTFLLILVGLYVIIERPLKVLKDTSSNDDSDDSNNIKENSLRKKREIDKFNYTERTTQRLNRGPSLTPAESTNQRLTGGPSLTHAENRNQRLAESPNLTHTENTSQKLAGGPNLTHTENTNQRLAGGPNLTHTESTSQRLAGGPNLTHIESTNQRLAGGPSLTHTLHSFNDNAMQDEGGGNRHFLETIPSMYHNATLQEQLLEKTRKKRWDTEARQKPQRKVDTDCVNPVYNKVDECIESMDKQVAEKCLPGINNMLDQLEKQYDKNKPGLYNLKAKESEVCLRDVFSKCTYESRFKIKTKVKQLVGVNLDIAFQEEFEMDCCDQDFMQENLQNAMDCFNKINTKPPELKCKPEEVSTELLKITGECIDDHTAFSCLTATTELFKNTMRELVLMLRKETLELLTQIGEDKYPHGRLCLKFIDFDRLQDCEADFFDYVLCLKNGTHVPGLYEKVVKCFQKALRVCPPSTIKLLIKTLAGAIEGKGGELEGDNFKIIVGTSGEGGKKPSVVGPVGVWQPEQPEIVGPGGVWQPGQPGVEGQGGVWQPGQPGVEGQGGVWQPGQPGVEGQGGVWQPGQPGVEGPGGVWQPGQPGVEGQGGVWQPGQPGVEGQGGVWKPGVVGPGGVRKPYPKGRPSSIIDVEELPHLPNKWSIKSPSRCGPDVIKPWISETEKCYRESKETDVGYPEVVKPEQGSNFETIIGPLFTCFREKRPKQCKFHKASKYFEICNMIPDLIQTVVPSDEKIRRCIDDLRSPKAKQCLAQLFMYYVSLNHAHYTQEAREKILYKARLCFKVNLPNCPQNYIDNLLRFFLVINNIGLPEIVKPKFVTRVTIPEGYIWCETRIISSELPVPPTTVITYKPSETQEEETITPTTTHRVKFTPPPLTKIFTPPPLRTKVFTIPPPPIIVERTITPTTVYIRTVTPPIHWRTETRPPRPTKVVFRTPPPIEFTERKTPTTIKVLTLTPPTFVPSKTFPPPRTIIYKMTPPQPIFTKIRTPTTIIPHTLTPPTEVFSKTKVVPTHQTFFPPQPKTFSQIYHFTTQVVTRPPRTPKWTITRRPPMPSIFTLPPAPKAWSKVIVPTTVRVTRFPQPPEVFTQVLGTSTIKIKVSETVPENCCSPPKHGPCQGSIQRWYYNKETGTCETFVWGGCMPNGNNFATKEECEETCARKTVPTRVFTFTPPGKTIEKTIRPTTVEYRTIIPPVKIPTVIIPGPKPTEIIFPPPPVTEIKKITPTTIRPIEITPPVIWRTRVQTPRPPQIFTFTPKPTDCYAEKDHGPCKQKIPRWYFNKSLGCCMIFIWGGCKPNGNNFETREECETTCGRRTVKTRIFTMTPKVPTWKQKKTETSVEIVFKEKTPSYTIEITKPSPTTKIFTIRPPPRIYTQPFPSSTIKIHTMTITGSEIIRRPTPPTIMELFTPQSKVVHFTRPPTTHREFTQRITPKIWRKTRPPPLVQIFTLTPPEHIVTKIIPPTQTRTVVIPFTTKVYEKTRPPVPPEVMTVPPKPFTYKHTHTPSTIKLFSIPPKPRTYTMQEQSTTILIKLTEKPEKPLTITMPPRVTCIITIPPSDCFSEKKHGPCKEKITRWFYNKVTGQCETFIYGGCEGNANNFRTKLECERSCMRVTIPRPTIRITQATPPPKIWVKTGPPAVVETVTFPPQETQFTKWITPPTFRTVTQSVPPLITRFTLPPVSPKIFTMTYPTIIEHRTRTPTTSRPVKYTIPPEIFTHKEKPTTIIVGIPEIKVFRWTEELVPHTEEFVFPPDTKKEIQVKFPTTVRIVTETITPRPFQKTRPPPPTIPVIFTPPGEVFTKVITPTTMYTFTVPFSVSQRVTRPPIKPILITAIPPEKPRTHRITPSTTEIWTAPPKPRTTMIFTLPPRPPKIVSKTPPGLTWGTHIVVTPKTVTYPPSPPEYTCVYPTPPSTTICTWIQRKCLPGEEVVWRDKILNCTLSQIKKKGMTIYKLIITDKNLGELKKIVQYCVKCIGDTICRNTTFPLAEWMLEKVDTYVGEYKERADTVDVINDDVYNEMKQCVIMAEESQVERCYPGLYLAMTDLILYEKPTRMIKYRKPEEGCLQEVFRHCKRFSKRKIEEKLENVFEFCIKITTSSEKSGCKRHGPPKSVVKVERKKCTGREIEKILIEMQNCVEREVQMARSQNGKIMVQRLLEISVKCLGNMPCDVEDIEGVMKFLSLLINSIVHNLDYEGKPRGKIFIGNSGSLCNDVCKTTGGSCRENVGRCVCPGNNEFSQEVGCISNKCSRNLGGMELRQCFKSVEGALKRIEQLQDRDALMEQIARCLANALRSCSSGAIRSSAKYFIKVICSSCKVPETNQPGNTGYEITHVGVTPSGVDVCGNVFRTEEVNFRSADRPRVEDDCVPIEESEGEGSMQVRVPACTEERVEKWLEAIRNCMEKKVTNIGLRNPDYLTLEKVIQILKDCEEQLTCRTKYREDFKKTITMLLQLVTTNVLAETDEQRNIRNALNYDKMGIKCRSILYKYLTFDKTEEQLKKSKAKEMECLQSSLKDAGSDVLDDLLDAFEIGMVLDENRIAKLYKEGKFKKCDTDEPVKERVHFYNAPSYMNCGPGGILVRKERNLESQLYGSSTLTQNLATEKIPFLKPVVKRASSTECTAEDFLGYFEQLLKCGQKKLHLKFRRKRNKCKLNDLKHSWTALVDCMIENIGDELTCQVTTEDMMNQFLQHVSRTLHSSSKNIDESCPTQPLCYGTEAPALSRCSNVYLQLLKAGKTNVPMQDILDGSFSVLECLNPIWPDCPPEVQFTALNFLYLPLGLNYDSNINQGLKFVSCDESQSPENSSFSRCMGKGGVNEIDAEQYDSSVEICMTCVRKKDGICISSSGTDLINHLEAEFTRINRCLKRIISDDNCLKDMTTRIQDKCMSDFYRLYKNITKGIVLNSIEYFSKFNSCLMSFKSECSEDYKIFTLHLYYDILGLSSVFKPQFPPEYDSTS